MSNLIDRQQAIEAICMETCGVSLKNERCMVHCTEVQAVEQLPPIQPKRGKWVLVCDNNGMHFVCNKCGAWRYHQEQNFCGECGADMRGEQDE